MLTKLLCNHAPEGLVEIRNNKVSRKTEFSGVQESLSFRPGRSRLNLVVRLRIRNAGVTNSSKSPDWSLLRVYLK